MAISPRAAEGSNSGSPFLHGENSKTHRVGKHPVPVRKGEVSFVAAGLVEGPAWPRYSETIKDLVGPEPLEAMQRLVERCKLLIGDAANLHQRLDVIQIE